MREVTLLVWFLALLMFVVLPQIIETQTRTKAADKAKRTNQVKGFTSKKQFKTISGRHSLLPSQKPVLPPFRNIIWLTSGKENQGEWGGGALAVVALGGPISRWLRPLHARASCPMLMWHASLQPGAAPIWLEDQAAYLLVAHNITRAHEFIADDTQYTVHDIDYTFISKDLSATPSNYGPHCYGEACLRTGLVNEVKIRDLNLMYLIYLPWHADSRVARKFGATQDPFFKLTVEVVNKFRIYPLENRLYDKIIRKRKNKNNNFADQMILKGLIKGEFDIAFRGFFALNIKRKIVDLISSTATIERMLVMVPSASNMPAWSLPFRTFGSTLWSCLLATLSVYAVAWRLVAGESMGASVAAALRAFSSCGGTPQERVTVCSQRLQLAGALLASGVVVASAYQGRLFTLLTHPDKQQEINTLQELADSGLYVANKKTYLYIMAMLHDDTVYSGEKLKTHRRLLQLPIMNISSANMAKNRDHFFFITTEHHWKITKGLYNYMTRPHCMEEHAFEATNVIYARKNWQLTSAVNGFILRLDGAGIRKHWEDQYKWLARLLAFSPNFIATYGDPCANKSTTRQCIILGNMNPSTEDKDEPFTFNMAHLFTHFQLLGAGLLLALLVFIGEQCWWRMEATAKNISIWRIFSRKTPCCRNEKE